MEDEFELRRGVRLLFGAIGNLVTVLVPNTRKLPRDIDKQTKQTFDFLDIT